MNQSSSDLKDSNITNNEELDNNQNSENSESCDDSDHEPPNIEPNKKNGAALRKQQRKEKNKEAMKKIQERREKDKQKNESTDTSSDEYSDSEKELTKSMKKIIKVENHISFNVGYMGEAYIYEDLCRLNCFEEITWNAKAEDDHHPCVILNNGNKYYIQNDGEHFDIWGTDKAGKKYYFEVKLTNKENKGNHISHAQNKYILQLTHNNTHYVLAKVMDVLDNPVIKYYMFIPKKGFQCVDVEAEHTEKYFVKSLYEKQTKNKLQ